MAAGDFQATDFGSAKYNLAIYSDIAHMQPPKENLKIFGK